MGHFLVTGGCGFVGSHLVDALVADGHAVTVLDDLSTGKAAQCHPTARLVIGSVTDLPLVQELVLAADGCFHLAAIASVPVCNRELLASHRVNVGGLINLFQAARRLERALPFVYASSAAVYGDLAGAAVETVRAAPLSHYGCDKLGCEQHAAAALQSSGIPSIGLRFFNVFGPRQDPASPYSGVISIFVDAARRGRAVQVFGDGRQTRDFVFVEDVVQAQLLAMELLRREHAAGRPLARVFNVCTGTPTTVLDLAATVFGCMGRTADVTFAPPRQGDIRMSVGAPAVAASGLGFRAATTLEDGIARTAPTAVGMASFGHVRRRPAAEVPCLRQA